MSATYLNRINGIETSLALKAPVRVSTTANITLSGEQTIDGVSAVSGDRVLVKDQTDTTENGIYEVGTSTWARTKDFNGVRDITQGTQVFVAQGSSQAGLLFAVATANPTVGSALTFTVLNELGLQIGVNVQAYDADLTSLANFGASDITSVVNLYRTYPITTGTSTAYVASTGYSLTSYPVGIPFLVVFHVECGDDPTLDVDGLGAKDLYARRRENGDLVQIKAGQIQAGASVMVRYNGTNFACWGEIRPREDLEYVVKPLDQVKVNTTTNDVDGHLNLNVSEVGLYHVNIGLNFEYGLGHLKYRINTPANSEMLLTDISNNFIYTGNSNLIRFDSVATPLAVKFSGILKTTESGNIQISWSQNVIHVDPTIIRKNSFISARYLGTS